MEQTPNIYTPWLLPGCTTNCSADGPACGSTPFLQSLPTQTINVKDYICKCQDEIASEYIRHMVSAAPYYGRLLFNMQKTNDKSGNCTYIPIFRDIKAKPSISQDGKWYVFYNYSGRRFFGEVLADGGNNTITVSDGNIFNISDVSISIVKPSSDDDCCFDKIIKRCGEWTLVSTGVDAFGNPTATLDIGADAALVKAWSRVMLRTDCLKKCEAFPTFDFTDQAKEYKSYIQDFGRQISIDLDEINSCGFQQLNDFVTNSAFGTKIMNLMQLKQQALYEYFDHQMLTAVNEGLNFARGATSGETMGIETAMNYARNSLGVNNYYNLTSKSPKAIFLRMREEVTKRQSLAGCNDVTYLVGTTKRGYAWIQQNQEFLRMAAGGCTPICGTMGDVVKMGQISIDTGMGKIEFAIDPRLDANYGEQLLYRFLPLGDYKFYTNKYKSINADGKLIEMPQGLHMENTEALQAWKYNCSGCRSYNFGFAFIPFGSLNWQAFMVRLSGQ